MARDFENTKTQKGIHYSRYIASWRRKGGLIYYGGLFERWLRDVEKLTEEEISDIMLMATTGKMELEMSAGLFMRANKDTEDYKFEHVDVRADG